MPVLVEAISVIVRRDAIDRSYRNGWRGFVSEVPNQTLCMDTQIARVGFMSPIDVRGFMAAMEKRGLTTLNAAGAFQDFAVIDQGTGLTAPCDWVEHLHIQIGTGVVSAARFKGSLENTLACPAGWTFENSLTADHQFHPGVEPGPDYEFLRVENGVDVYRHKESGREYYTGRTTPP